MRIFVLGLLFCLLSNLAFANGGWIPYNHEVSPPVVEVPLVPSITYSTTITTQPTLTYRWIPIYVNKPVVINNYGIFCRRQQIIYQPTIEWVYQPYYIK